MRIVVLAAVLFGAAAVCGCEGTQPKTALGYTEDAKRAYDTAMEEFNAHSWIEAQTLMREVKRKYSYSKWARQAELRIADADVEQEKFPEAIREYKDFVHAHRSDTEDCIYARAKMAEATFAEIPESFLMPASEERDQAAVIDAYKELRSFLEEYPEAKQVRRMRELLGNVTARLVRHELYVARFYLRKDALKNYGEADQAIVTGADSGLKAEALLLLGTTYLKMNKWTEARQAFEALVRNYAQSPLATEARNYLEYLKEKGA